MTAPPPSDARRAPRVFRADDPDLVVAAPPPEPPPRNTEPSDDIVPRAAVGSLIERGFRWGTVLISALASAAALSVGLWFWRLISVGWERDDWLGLAVRSLVGVAAIAAVALLLRELVGWRRLARLGRLRRSVGDVLTSRDVETERKVVDRILGIYGGRPDLRWALDRVAVHRSDVLDPGALLTIVERDVMAPLDGEARRLITTSAKRVATVTALAPLMSLAFAFVVYENLALLRRLASVYGGRPGFAAAVRLARTVVGNLIAAGGLAMTDDLLGQFIGQDVLRRLSRRLGEGAFNGALTARIGVAALAEVRPMPYLALTPPRARDILAEVIRPMVGRGEKPAK
jgi:putative membrane protein